jgi:hypothetical protein
VREGACERERVREGACEERASEGESSQLDTELYKGLVDEGRTRASLNQAASQFAPAGVKCILCAKNGAVVTSRASTPSP